MAAVQSLPGYAGMNDGIPVQPAGSTICTGEETGKSSAGGSAADQGKLEKYRDADTGDVQDIFNNRCAEI